MADERLTDQQVEMWLDAIQAGRSSERIATARDSLWNSHHAYRAEIERLTAELKEDRAVCLCGCPLEAHENLGEDGEACEDEEHFCLRVAPAVLAYANEIRENWRFCGEDIEELRGNLTEEKERADSASALVAQMHAAAVGSIRGPIRGVAEDVADVRDMVRQLVKAMRRWAAEEDGLPESPIGARGAVARAEALIGPVEWGYGTPRVGDGRPGEEKPRG